MDSIPVVLSDKSFPVTVTFCGGDENTFRQWFLENTTLFRQLLQHAGGILLKGLAIDSIVKFERLLAVFPPLRDYVDGNSPRKKLSSKVYTSTEYDSSKSITLHNEFSYSHQYPSQIDFCCIHPATHGGETPVADGRKVLTRISKETVDKIEKHGVQYIRNLHSGDGIGPSWQSTFETADRRVVEEFCRSTNTRTEWTPGGGLRLVSDRPGIIRHPVTNERVWFSQIDQFHPLHLGEEYYQTLTMLYPNEEDLPAYVRFGDGTAIPPAVVDEIRAAMDREAVPTQWEKGDALVLDNILVSHGRKPFQGSRTVLVAMS
jgi:alpha-ketoglutarate-dependent taurine dioxygenase